MGRNPEDLAIFIGRRLLQLLPVLFGVIALTFFVTHVAAIDPCPRWYERPGSRRLCTARPSSASRC